MEASFASWDYSLFVALNCDVQPRASADACQASGAMRLPTDKLDPAEDPEVGFAAEDGEGGGSLVIDAGGKE